MLILYIFIGLFALGKLAPYLDRIAYATGTGLEFMVTAMSKIVPEPSFTVVPDPLYRFVTRGRSGMSAKEAPALHRSYDDRAERIRREDEAKRLAR